MFTRQKKQKCGAPQEQKHTPLHDHLTVFDFVSFKKEYDRGSNPNIVDRQGRNVLEYSLFLLEDLIECSLCTSFAVDTIVSPAEIIPLSVKMKCRSRALIKGCRPVSYTIEERLNIMVSAIKSLVSIIQTLSIDRGIHKKNVKNILSQLPPAYFFMSLMLSIFEEYCPNADDSRRVSNQYTADIVTKTPRFATVDRTPSPSRSPSGRKTGGRNRKMDTNKTQESLSEIFDEIEPPSQFNLLDVRRLVNYIRRGGMRYSRQLEFLSLLPMLMVKTIECFGYLKFTPPPECAQRFMQLAFVFDCPQLFKYCCRCADVFSAGDLSNWSGVLTSLAHNTHFHHEFFFALLNAKLKARLRRRLCTGIPSEWGGGGDTGGGVLEDRMITCTLLNAAHAIFGKLFYLLFLFFYFLFFYNIYIFVIYLFFCIKYNMYLYTKYNFLIFLKCIYTMFFIYYYIIILYYIFIYKLLICNKIYIQIKNIIYKYIIYIYINNIYINNK
eukprot:GHVR01119466.1.p1 GENE.GHVR01119466.1~~GHVR01119466.1.p1  ORF type:complete len:495 (-),score=89.71 GHVR01119466.1:40-1524(-)